MNIDTKLKFKTDQLGVGIAILSVTVSYFCDYTFSYFRNFTVTSYNWKYVMQLKKGNAAWINSIVEPGPLFYLQLEIEGFQSSRDNIPLANRVE